MALKRSADYQISFESIGLSVQEKPFNIDFQDGGYLRFLIGTVLANVDLQVDSIRTSNEVSSQLTFILKKRKRLSASLMWRSSWMSDWNDCSFFCIYKWP